MFKVEVIADNSGKWCGNGLTFETIESAHTYARDLFMRWVLVRQWRIVEIETNTEVKNSAKVNPA